MCPKDLAADYRGWHLKKKDLRDLDGWPRVSWPVGGSRYRVESKETEERLI